jgi:TolA-binding protein
MKKIVLIGTAGIAMMFASACGEKNPHGDVKADTAATTQLTKEQLLDSIHGQETRMSKSKTYDPAEALGAMRLYVEYSNRFPKDTMTAEYLFRASDIAQGTGNYQQAAEYLEIILSEHTGYRNYPDACFAAALVYDNYLENVNDGATRAVEIYDFIIEKYPTSYYAEQAKVLKTYIGKPDSVFYNDIEAKMKANQ